jgi:excisionase family DNA binding protein
MQIDKYTPQISTQGRAASVRGVREESRHDGRRFAETQCRTQTETQKGVLMTTTADKQHDSMPMAINFSEAARMSGLDRRRIKAGVENGTIPSLRFGPKVLIPRAAFLRLLESGSAN